MLIKELKDKSKEELINEIIKRENLLRHFFTSKYHRLRVILFYLKRFIYIILFRDFKNKFRDIEKIDKVIKQKDKNKKSIKVLYDFQTFAAQKVGGISRLFSEVIKNLVKDNLFSVELALRYSENFYLKNLSKILNKKVIIKEPPLKHIDEIFPPSPFNENSLLINLFRKLFLKILSLKYISQPGGSFFSLKGPDYFTYYEANRKVAIDFLKKGTFDIFHPTYYDTYFLKYLKGKPFILTIFDMIHEKFSEHIHPNDIIAKEKKILAQKATKIIAISKQTKRDIINILNIPEEKIVVIPLATSFNKKMKLTKVDNLPKKYLLFVGQRIGYKNFNFFIKSIAPLLRKDKDLFVVCVGDFPASGPFTEEELNLFKRLKIQKKMIYIKADDSKLAYLYAKAYAFVFPTLYEGFGIPILEAFSMGCPVVCSEIPVLKEVAEDGVLYFNPKSSKSILDAIKKILTDKKLRSELIKKGYKINSKYSWRKTTDLIKEVYKNVLDEKK